MNKIISFHRGCRIRWSQWKTFALLCCAPLLASSFLSFAADSTDPFARITSVQIERTNILVEVEASHSVRRITLESSPRVGRHAWEPRAVRWINAEAEGLQRFSFSAPISPDVEILRVRGDFGDDLLPEAFYSGKTNFTIAQSAGPGGIVNFNPETGAPTTDAGSDGAGEQARSVVESDIWKLEGDTLFFFNQYRGLQIIDVSNPDAPVVTGTYDMIAAGEQMYVIDGTRVVLLARDNCSWYGSSSESRVVLLELRDGQPELVKELPVKGFIEESRLVGTALYVVASSYQVRELVRPDSNAVSEQWEWGSEAVSFDLADFTTATEKSREWISGYGNVIHATDRSLFVAQAVYNYEDRIPPTSLIHCFDIASPDGTFTKVSTFDAGGSVRDKFKMHLNDDVLTAVTQIDPFSGGVRSTWVNTFSLANPAQPQSLGKLKLIENEQLFATRFSGDTLYAVTYFLVDPLWVVDLGDPENPRRVGELHIPGWSTYLHPMGDQLLAIGIDDADSLRRTAVQLFDVSDPANPTLQSKVVIGDQWSSSEANWDEKAFGVMPEHNLVLVPFSSHSEEGYQQGVQLIDLEDGRLVKRGIIPQDMGARRATLHRERILSLTARELLTVNATNRDEPVVVKSTTLSWAADQVHLAGNYLVEVDANSSGSPVLRVVEAENPAALANSLALTNLPWLGSMILGDKLYVLQGKSAQILYWDPVQVGDAAAPATNTAPMVLSEVDLSNLPEIQVTAQALNLTSTNIFHGRYKGLLVRENLIVWASRSYGGYDWWGWGGPMMPLAEFQGAGIAADMAMPYWGGPSENHFLAVSLADNTPKFVSEVRLSREDGGWSSGEVLTANGMVFSSRETSHYDPAFDPPPTTYEVFNGKEYTLITNDAPAGAWVRHHFLDVVDFNDATDPLVRAPVNIPGSLLGLDRGGELLFTRGPDTAEENIRSGAEVIAAVAYDGIQASQVAILPLPANWPRPALVNEGNIYLGIPPSGETQESSIESWGLGEEGNFERFGSLSTAAPVQSFKIYGNLLAAQSSEILLFDATAPAALRQVGEGAANSCLGVQLDGADGSVERGLWIPAGWHGVIKISVTDQN